MCAAAVSALNLSQNGIDVSGGIGVAYRRTDDVKFLAGIAGRFTPPRPVQRLADPFCNGHMPRARHALNFTVVGVLQDYLESFSHIVSVSDSHT